MKDLVNAKKKKKKGRKEEREREGEYGGHQIKRKTLPVTPQTEKPASSRLVWRARAVPV